MQRHPVTPSNLAGIILECQSDVMSPMGGLTQAAQFWSHALGFAVKPSGNLHACACVSYATRPERLHIELRAVEHASQGYIQLHAEDVEAEVERLERLGAARVQQIECRWIMVAPTGHRFCVLPKAVVKGKSGAIGLGPVGENNWRDIVNIEVLPNQRRFVAPPAYYLTLCHYGSQGWQPLAIYREDELIGMMIWTEDPADGACWFGGITIDRRHQRQGHGRRALRLALALLGDTYGYGRFALSYKPDNPAKNLYRSLGFSEKDEWVDDEVVARLNQKTDI